MGYLDAYVNHFAIKDLDDAVKEKLEKFRDIIEEITGDQVNSPIAKIVNEYADEIIDLIERLVGHFDSWDLSVEGVWATFKFVYSISLEITQLVNDIAADIFSDIAGSAEERKAKIEIIKDLVFFVWQTVGPIDKLPWGWVKMIPFRARIERWLVRWLAGIAADAILDMFKANDMPGIMALAQAKSPKKKGKSPAKVTAVLPTGVVKIKSL
jgi:hypothetical protein